MSKPPILTTETILACAHAAHEVNRAYCRGLGDMSQPPWDEAPEWQRRSAINGVVGVLIDGNGPRESHESWSREKLAAGWTLGPVKDPEAKTHPCLVPYDQLPPEQQQKDQLYIQTVAALATALQGWRREEA